jgi:penicillin amidase
VSSWLRAASIAALALAVLLAARAGLRWWTAGDQRGPAVMGQLVLADLAAGVTITRDPFGVPHVEAESESEAWLGLGFAHAQDRLVQMELLRRAARGRLAEIFGARALDGDRLARLLGLASASEQEAAELSGAAAETLAAYCRGVNAWLGALERGVAPRPRELDWLDVRPEPWVPADVLAIVRWRAWNSARSLGSALLLDRLVRELGGVPAREFFPVRPSDGAHDALAALLDLSRAADALAGAGGLSERTGSLGFAIGPSRSASGMPLLASDPHVALDLPPVFYLAHVRAPGLELAGATARRPGARSPYTPVCRICTRRRSCPAIRRATSATGAGRGRSAGWSRSRCAAARPRASRSCARATGRRWRRCSARPAAAAR